MPKFTRWPFDKLTEYLRQGGRISSFAWGLETLSVRYEFRVNDSPISASALHPDRSQLATPYEDLTIRTWHYENDPMLDKPRTPPVKMSLDYAPDG